MGYAIISVAKVTISNSSKLPELISRKFKLPAKESQWWPFLLEFSFSTVKREIYSQI
jgi:hypothetical protein